MQRAKSQHMAADSARSRTGSSMRAWRRNGTSCVGKKNYFSTNLKGSNASASCESVAAKRRERWVPPIRKCGLTGESHANARRYQRAYFGARASIYPPDKRSLLHCSPQIPRAFTTDPHGFRDVLLNRDRHEHKLVQ